MISSTMPSCEIGQILTNHHCKDVTWELDLNKCGKLPIRGGGFGDVYQGALLGGKRVALKCARMRVSSSSGLSQETKNLARELYTWSKCKHANILDLHGLALYNNQIAIVSPWMDNGTLPHYIDKNPEVNVQNLCYQVSIGVEYLHSMGVVHGDIKGANVLIAGDGTAKLADFGNTILRAYSLRFSGTLDDAALSVRWTAPELLSGATGVSREADIYALGMTILEAFTRDVPFQGKSETAVLGDVMLREKTPVREEEYFPQGNAQKDALWKMLQGCWSGDPKVRPLAKEIRKHLGASPPRTYLVGV